MIANRTLSGCQASSLRNPGADNPFRQDVDKGLPFSSNLHAMGVDGFTRRALVQQIKLGAARYRMQLDVDAYLSVAGRATLAGLETTQLRVLAQWVQRAIDRMHTACDSPDEPPAR